MVNSAVAGVQHVLLLAHVTEDVVTFLSIVVGPYSALIC
jgi:hypothetical protein